jgi:hypothetical protein
VAINLPSELRRAAEAVTQSTIDRLRALGVRVEWLADYPTYPFGVLRAEAVGDGLFQASNDGSPHLILPVLEDGELVDLIAFRAADPGGWLLRSGEGWCLGLADGLSSLVWRDAVNLHATPLDWLRAEGDGLCILDWSAALDIRQLDVLPHIICADQTTADNLRRAMTRPVRLPRISVMGALANAA